ncbi:hypothetical protein J6590_077835 [Homalodisca vitripennis]|nr:hypothetical protein J6590_077835 [Homalodisca vitripennis]
MAANESHKLLSVIKEVLNIVCNNKVIILDIRSRYNLPDWSYVNREVKNSNKALKEIIKVYPNVLLIEVSLVDRHLDTHHGMHLNCWGKRWLAETICKTVKGQETCNTPTDFQQQNGLQSSDSPSSSTHVNRSGQSDHSTVVSGSTTTSDITSVHGTILAPFNRTWEESEDCVMILDDSSLNMSEPQNLSASVINTLAYVIIHHLEPTKYPKLYHVTGFTG